MLQLEVLFKVAQYNNQLELHALWASLGEEKSVGKTTVTHVLVQVVIALSSNGFIDFLDKLVVSLAVGDGYGGGITGTANDVLNFLNKYKNS